MKPHFREKLQNRLDNEENFAITPIGQLTQLMLNNSLIRVSDIARLLDHDASSVTRWFSHTKNVGGSVEKQKEINNKLRNIVKAIKMIPEDVDLYGRADEIIGEYLVKIED